MERNNYHFVLDAGHGGINEEGEYVTSGKRSPKWPDGRQLFEGEFNRKVIDRVAWLLGEKGIKHAKLIGGYADVPLSERSRVINRMWEDDKQIIVISVHANAGGGTGFELFTSPGYTRSDKFASIFHGELVLEFPELRDRSDWSDGDPDKEANFWMLTKTKPPSLLIECGFMDTLDPDFNLLHSKDGPRRFANAIVSAITKIEYEQAA